MRIGNHLDSNHFAYPLDICAELSGDRKVRSIMWLPSGEGERAQEAGAGYSKKFDKRKIHKGSEYHPELREQTRETTKSYIVQQPDGPSFKVEENLLTWEKWRMRVGFNYVSSFNHLKTRGSNISVARRLDLAQHYVSWKIAILPSRTVRDVRAVR
jgi:primary-amine oxidase